MKKLVLVAVLMAVTPVVIRAQTPATRDSLSLDQVVERVLRVSPDIISAENAVDNANSGYRVAWGAFLPSLSLSSGYSLASTTRFNAATNTTVSAGSADSYTASLSSSLDLFTAGRRGAEMRRTNAVTDAAEAALTASKFAVSLAAKQAYFDVAKAGELASVAQASLQRANEGYSAAERRMQVGTATRSDVLRAQLEQMNAKQALLAAQTQESSAAFALGRLVGSEKPVYAKTYTQTAPRPLSLTEDQLLEMVGSNAPAVQSAVSNYNAARASASSAKTQYFPSLRLTGGYDWFNQNPQFNGGRLSWSTRLGLSYPLFNGFSREDAVQRADAAASSAAASAADAKLKARADLEKTLNALKLAEANLGISKEAVAVAQEDLRVQEERYRLGMSTILDRITSQVNLKTAENNEVAARYDYEIARAQLEALIGRAL